MYAITILINAFVTQKLDKNNILIEIVNFSPKNWHDKGANFSSLFQPKVFLMPNSNRRESDFENYNPPNIFNFHKNFVMTGRPLESSEKWPFQLLRFLVKMINEWNLKTLG